MKEKWINKKYLKLYVYNGGFWFRIFGYGLRIKDIRKHPLLFSERNCLIDAFRVGNLSVKLVKK